MRLYKQLLVAGWVPAVERCFLRVSSSGAAGFRVKLAGVKERS
jgi:hypothetical protein